MFNAFVDKFATFQEFFIPLFIQRHCVTYLKNQRVRAGSLKIWEVAQ